MTSWSAGNQLHDIIYSGYGTNTGDYSYIKAAGNSSTNHGIGVFTDNVFAVGQIDQNTGGVTNSATAPIDTTWMYVNSSGLTVDGSVNTGDGGVTTTIHGDSGDWYQASLDGAASLSRTTTTAQTVASNLTLNGTVTINDPLYTKVTSSQYTPPLRVERSGGSGATLATISTIGTHSAGFTFRTYYTGTTMQPVLHWFFILTTAISPPLLTHKGIWATAQ